jgi:membrane-associated phospholipid phosphatase
MTSRRDSMLYLLCAPVLVHAAPRPLSPQPAPPHSHDGPLPGPSYRTQPGTTELPPRYGPPPGLNATRRIAYWNEAVLRAIAFDATPAFPAQPPLTFDQLGPTRASRAVAIVQIAVFDALNAIFRRYPPYVGPLPAFADSLPDAAIAQAAHDALVALYPRQAARFGAWLSDDLARLPSGRATLNGIDIGRRAAAAILALRADDGFYQDEPVVGVDYPFLTQPGQWRPDPVSRNPIALGAHWGRVKPFALQSGEQFCPPPPPPLASPAYAAAFNEVRQLGGDGVTTPTTRTPDQTRIGIFWGYDGGAWIGTRPRQYNQIAVQLALARTTDPLNLARLLALANVAMADAAIAGWASKYDYRFWRPVIGIREASPGSGPTGQGDGNPDTRGDPNWTPLGSPASNLIGPNFTPPFPSYVSGHAVLGSAMFEVLRRFYGDAIAFTFVSDEFNGITRDNQGRVRPLAPRSYGSLSQAEAENGVSRLYLGVHWPFDIIGGSAMGRQIGDYVFARGLVQPGN